MTWFRLSNRATCDLEQIADYLQKRNPEAALRILNALQARFELLGSNPAVGAAQRLLGADIKSFSSPPYVIYFRATPRGVEICRVVHSARDLRSLED